MTNRLARWLLWVIIVCLPVGCSRPARLEELNIVYGIAFDAEKTGSTFEATYHVPFYQKESVKNVTVSVSGDSSKETQGLAELQLSGKLGDDKMKLILIDGKLAADDINSLIQPFIRDRRVPTLIKIVVTEKSAKSFLEIKANQLDPSTHVVNLIRENERQNVLPETSLYHFLNNWANPGEDPYLPLMSIQKNKSAITGIALFKDTKQVETLRGYDNLMLFALLQRSVPNAKYKLDWKERRIAL